MWSILTFKTNLQNAWTYPNFGHYLPNSVNQLVDNLVGASALNTEYQQPSPINQWGCNICLRSIKCIWSAAGCKWKMWQLVHSTRTESRECLFQKHWWSQRTVGIQLEEVELSDTWHCWLKSRVHKTPSSHLITKTDGIWRCIIVDSTRRGKST